MTTHSWTRSVFLNGDVVKEIKKLKQQEATNLQGHGSSDLLQTLQQHNWVDELWLKFYPLTLGSGKRLVGKGTQPSSLALTHAQALPSGVVVANYTCAGKVMMGSF